MLLHGLWGISLTLAWVVTAAAADDQPIGWASVAPGTTGGAGGETVTVGDAAGLEAAVRGESPRIVQITGSIKLSRALKVGSNKTLLGTGDAAQITGAGITLKNVQNVIVRHLKIHDCEIDAINVEAGSQRVWIDHCDLSRCGDGLLDIKTGSDLVTVSWCHFHDHHKTSLLGHSDKEQNLALDRGKLRVTYHHNFFDGTSSRHPRVRAAELVHVFNNYYRRNEYGIAATMGAAVLVEGNYFEQVESPTHTRYASSKIPGRLVERDNVFVRSGSPETAGEVAEPRTHYAYQLDPAADVPRIVTAGAGTRP